MSETAGVIAMRRSTKWWAVGLTVGLTAVVGISAQQVMAEQQSLSGLTASATVHASRLDVWYGQLTGRGICRLLPGCESATKTDAGWTFRIGQTLPQFGRQSIEVTATQFRRTRPSRIAFALSSDSTLGTVQADVTLRLKRLPDHRTRLTIHVGSARATGVAARVVIPQLRDNLQDNLRSTAKRLDLIRHQSRIRTTLDLRALKGSHRRRVVAGVHLRLRSLAIREPNASGRMRVLAGNRVVCTGPVRRSKGQCRFPSPRSGVRVRGVVTGWYDNGYQVWNTGSRRWRP